MKQTLPIVATILTLALAAPSPVSGASAGDDETARFRWQNRVLLVFSPTPALPAYQSLAYDLTRNQDGVRERDLVVFLLFGDGESRLGEEVLSAERTENLRRRFDVKADEYKVVLVGKDGLVKLSSDTVTLTDLFVVIDAMPMRRLEMRDRPSDGSPSR